ncbi:ABC transporter substrate-binding protein [Billgrantia endophytica]|uniref:ABC transporter substrate-binding protein n=1 Tax=Billgrantia endophytica TaxID=2033802 RepID=A0A2N7TYN4_9GAMM|nr:extracellular solute-binding protein [Halomonas endophytica]PMR73297.1 ABC transporter substrate-binding protein [Halomonas endophytica]
MYPPDEPKHTEACHAGLSRRRFLRLLAQGGLLLAAAPQPLSAATPPESVTVLTGYPDEMMRVFEAAFERAHPHYRLNLLWRTASDALPYLLQDGAGVDVYWSASPRTFARLKAENRLQPLPVQAEDLPERIGGTRISDPQGHYLATEVAGYGFVVNEAELARRRVPLPRDWPDLADPRLARAIVLPTPGQVGFASVLVDIPLQRHGWPRGWALWSEIAGLSRLIPRGGSGAAEEVAGGAAAIGLTIDFFAHSAIARGMPLRFIYPKHGGINPAHVAQLKAAPNPEGAQAFIDFLLSREGQTLLAHRDIHKLPVRPDVYAGLPADYHNPFQAAARGGYAYDNDAGRPRLALVASLFDTMLAQDHARLVDLWSRIHRAEDRGEDMRAIRRVLCRPPIDERAAASDTLLASFANRLEGNRDAPGEMERHWRRQVDSTRTHVETLLDGANA